EDLRALARRSRDRSDPAGERGDDATPCARGGHLRRHLLGRRARGGDARERRSEERGHRARRVRPRRPLSLDRDIPLVTPILVFDIETIPDAKGLRTLWDLDPSVSDAAVVELASQRRRQ